MNNSILFLTKFLFIFIFLLFSACYLNPTIKSNLSKSDLKNENGYLFMLANTSGSQRENQVGLYTLGGNVSSLNGSLILNLNNSESLTISQNGIFQFSTTFPSGNSYSISVTTQPQGMYCYISNGSGTITSNITNVSINCISGNSNGTLVGGGNFQ
ncbi:MAG: hypothetical protein KDK36_13885 [Leptospiraceae bacterium]|nr:hypothetical protein [Leptospiraceae bacterium]